MNINTTIATSRAHRLGIVLDADRMSRLKAAIYAARPVNAALTAAIAAVAAEIEAVGRCVDESFPLPNEGRDIVPAAVSDNEHEACNTANDALAVLCVVSTDDAAIEALRDANVARIFFGEEENFKEEDGVQYYWTSTNRPATWAEQVTNWKAVLSRLLAMPL